MAFCDVLKIQQLLTELNWRLRVLFNLSKIDNGPRHRMKMKHSIVADEDRVNEREDLQKKNSKRKRDMIRSSDGNKQSNKINS